MCSQFYLPEYRVVRFTVAVASDDEILRNSQKEKKISLLAKTQPRHKKRIEMKNTFQLF